MKRLVFSVVIFLFSCHPRSFHTDAKSHQAPEWNVNIPGVRSGNVPLNRPVYMFHYFNSSLGTPGMVTRWRANDAQRVGWLKGVMEEARGLNHVANPSWSNMAAGAGLYVAEDPVSSNNFGNTLLVLKAAPGRPVYAARHTSDLELRQSEAPAIYYPWEGWYSGDAMVIRSEDFIAQEDGFLLKKPETPSDLAAYTPLSAQEMATWDLPELLNHHMAFILDIDTIVKTLGRFSTYEKRMGMAIDELERAFIWAQIAPGYLGYMHSYSDAFVSGWSRLGLCGPATRRDADACLNAFLEILRKMMQPEARMEAPHADLIAFYRELGMFPPGTDPTTNGAFLEAARVSVLREIGPFQEKVFGLLRAAWLIEKKVGPGFSVLGLRPSH